MIEADTVTERSARSSSGPRARGCIPVLVALVVVVGLCAAAGFAVWRGTGGLREQLAGPEDFSGDGAGSAPVTVRVDEGDTAVDIGATLEAKGVVASEDAFTDAASADSRSTGIQPGYYSLHEEMSAQSALAVLLDTESKIELEITVAEGLTVTEVVDHLATETDLPLRAYTQAARRTDALGLPDYAGDSVEGYLFPATYTLPPDVTASEVLDSMVERFRQAADELGLVAGANELGLTPDEVVTVASLVQAEARREEDFPRVAAVIYNRLEQGMPLQLDSTVQYATGGTGVFTTGAERRSTSAYNTYRVKGLPPGPINAAGELALQAALDPTDADWTYFVTVDLKTGRTEFTDRYRQHLRNVAELRRYCTTSGAC